MTLLKRDNNELRYNSIWLLEKKEPDYYKQLFRNTKAFFIGMKRLDLVKEMDKIISKNIEKKLGSNINHVLFVYKNLPYLNSFTRPRIDGLSDKRVYKYMIEEWLDEIEKWIFKKCIELEKNIRFSTPPKQWI